VLAGEAATQMRETFRAGMSDLGYVEGQNFILEWRSFTNRFIDLDELAAELVGLGVQVIVASTTPAALAAKRATSSIPIVFLGVSDPVGTGLVASLGHPGGNATGLSDFGAALSGKRLELLRDAVPGVARVGLIWGSRNPASALILRETQAAAPALGVELISLEVRGEDPIDGAFEAAVRERVDALIVVSSPDTADRAAAEATELRLPALLEQPTGVAAGGLMAYGPRRGESNRRAATYVDKILKGAKPADLPVEQPTTFDFVINLKTAQTLGLTIPQHVLLQATEVIQ